jgi:hypothetical protein
LKKPKIVNALLLIIESHYLVIQTVEEIIPLLEDDLRLQIQDIVEEEIIPVLVLGQIEGIIEMIRSFLNGQISQRMLMMY